MGVFAVASTISKNALMPKYTPLDVAFSGPMGEICLIFVGRFSREILWYNRFQENDGLPTQLGVRGAWPFSRHSVSV